MQRRRSLIISIFFLSVVAVPLALFAVGLRPEPLDNRPVSVTPELTLDNLLSGDFGTEGDRYLEDALPGRDVAVRVDAEIDLALQDSPSPEVAIGWDDWLFLRESLDQECLTDEDVAGLVEQIRLSHEAALATCFA